jgi:hypothetical protein
VKGGNDGIGMKMKIKIMILKTNDPCRSVDKFLKTLAKLASRQVFSFAKLENNWQKYSKSWWLLANPEFYSHFANWRVVISTPALVKT